MIVKYTTFYEKWFLKIKDIKIQSMITRRIYKIKFKDYLGDYKYIDKDLYELRFFNHSGIRIYFTIKNKELIILLFGGDKDNQENDIKKAKEILKELK